MAGDTRTRMIDATLTALQRHGVAGMSFTEVLKDSGAARGAIYHHFPGGKAQIVAEAAAQNGQVVQQHLSELPADSPRAVVTAFLQAIRPVVRTSTEGGGCAVAAITVADSSELRQVADTAFTSWIDQLTERLTAAGLPRRDATDLATTLVTLLEGAHVLCRAAGDLTPFDRAARAARELVESRYT